MSILIVTDSASDIEQGELRGVRVLPMTVTIDGTPYRDGLDLTKDEFYRLLKRSEMPPATSLISPFMFQETFDEIEAAGDEAIVITISSELSGTYQSAKAVAEGRKGISVIDSLQVTAPQKLLVLRALQLVLLGLTRDEIVRELEEEKQRIVVYAAVDTLEYLLKGGRITKSSALIGGVIGIKPILTLQDGKLIPIGKAHGSKKSHEFLNHKVREVGGIDFAMPYAVGYSGASMSNLKKYLDSNKEILSTVPHSPDIVQIGSAVGTHAGPGAVLVTFFKKAGEPAD
ncbi:MAG: DegV family protein [Coriobacteriaceae bacterium]|nr:DegV family protein [Coriobacteriaceae bacterium]